MSLRPTSDLWWKNAVVYCLDVETFYDSDGDGCGDFAGLTDRLDYLGGIGVSCVWLMPFYPSPRRDDGYDISDFYGVDPRLGTHGDFVAFVRTARDRGIRVIADLVVNHTSDAHPWFQAARADRDSPYRDFYVWSDTKPEEKPGDVVFPDKEDSNWAWDEQAGQWYLHRFYSHQPDLNVANPAVRDELAQIIGFWLEQGLSGFRVDAVPFLLEPMGMPEGSLVDPHELVRDLRSFAQRRNGEAMLLGEVNLEPPEARKFFGDEDGDELHMLFDFVGMQAMYLSLARRNAEPLRTALREAPGIPEDCQWGRFVRNHDELTLDKLSEAERQEVFAAFGPEESLQVFGRGLRRRLPPMLDADQQAIRMVYSLAFSLPGTPVLFYGEEIGMGENLDIEGRLSVRSPMQWSDERHGGFSTADDPRSLARPVVDDGAFGPEQVNVTRQRREEESLLNWFEKLIRRRRECPEIGFGTLEVLDAGAPGVFAHRCDWDGSTIVALHDLGGRPVTVTLTLDGPDDAEALVDLFSSDALPLDRGSVELKLEAHACRWFRVRRRGRRLPP
ncbi:MAG: alpha-amylase family protein [Solirubrobacterales bacterium]|nr:alpha-amylase family protein [Solirubrobacterales bacterium]